MATQIQSATIASIEGHKPGWPKQSWLILFIGGMCYGLLCWPLIAHGPVAPTDPVWSAMPFLWIVPLLVYKIFDAQSLLQRAWPIVSYTIATAFVATAGNLALFFRIPVSPHDEPLAFAPYLVFVGTVHLCATFAILLVMELARWLLRQTFTSGRGLEWSAKLVALSIVLAVAVAFPLVVRERLLEYETQDVIEQAETDWRHEAVVHVADGSEITIDHKGKAIERFIDLNSGLPINTRTSWTAGYWVDYIGLYNGRVRALIAEQGAPSWALKAHPALDDDLAEMLDSPDLMEVTTFPLYVNDNVSVRGSGNLLRIEARNVEHYTNTDAELAEGDFSTSFGPVFVGRSTKHPELTFLRRGNKWIGAYHASGELLSAAYDNDKRLPRWPDEE